MGEARQPFYKDKFCEAVTGYTDRVLRERISEGYVTPQDHAIDSIAGHDMPRSSGEVIADRLNVFMDTPFKIPLRDVPIDELYAAFKRFKEWEEYVHPRDNGFELHENYWGPAYRAIEDAYAVQDERGVKLAIMDLVDKIIHD
ncbi:hypothetical protein HY732_00145 [Candidatus Uhrbacteria bacterium]|nr:hypothetical protein [Candidatus Uhrbacteria bacterium]